MHRAEGKFLDSVFPRMREKLKAKVMYHKEKS